MHNMFPPLHYVAMIKIYQIKSKFQTPIPKTTDLYIIELIKVAEVQNKNSKEKEDKCN